MSNGVKTFCFSLDFSLCLIGTINNTAESVSQFGVDFKKMVL